MIFYRKDTQFCTITVQKTGKIALFECVFVVFWIFYTDSIASFPQLLIQVGNLP
jgi:hypothetical protein